MDVEQLYTNRFYSMSSTSGHLAYTNYDIPELNLLCAVISVFHRMPMYTRTNVGFVKGETLLTYKDIFSFVHRSVEWVYVEDKEASLNWTDLFDSVLTRARKQGFYTNRLPIHIIEGVPEHGVYTGICIDRKLFSGICSMDVTKLLQIRDKEILYIGDSLKDDII